MKKQIGQVDYYKRVILHLDLDCFYAQVEHNRLKIPLTVPLAVQQWNGLIAVNYAARDAGIKRHVSVAEALIKCPQLRLVHVPTYSISSIDKCEESVDGEVGGEVEIVALPRYSDEIPAYRADGTRLPPNPPDTSSNKACLEPYRHASMDIFRLIRSWCSELGEGNLVEKGGLDEAFIDISEEVEQQLIDQFAEKYVMLRDELDNLTQNEEDRESLENLELYDTSWIDNDLDFSDLGEKVISSSEIEIEDIVEMKRMKLGKLRIWKGAQIAKTLRSLLKKKLSFIASIGIAPNKMLAKLVSALYKPDKQTRIEPESVAGFMSQVPFEKIRMMGGKMGRSVIEGEKESADNIGDNGDDGFDFVEDDANDDHFTNSTHNTSSDNTTATTTTTVMASDLWPLSIKELTDRVADKQAATRIHQLIRGLDLSPVTPRSLTKSFMSAKSFRPAVKDWPELHDWVVVLIGELWSRIGEEKEGTGRWPSTITIHFKSFSKSPTSSNYNPQSNWSNSGSTTKSCEFPFSSTIPSQATRSHFLASTFKLLSFASASLFPMSRLAVSVTNFKGLEADGKAKATRVDQYFLKQSSSEYQLPPSLDRLFPTIQQQPSQSQKSLQVQPIKKSSVSVLDMLVASAKPRKSLESTPSNTSENSPLNTLENTNANTPQKHPASKKVKTKQQSTVGILNFFQKSENSNNLFSCNQCKFTCDKTDEKEIQEHSDYHFALKMSRE